MPLIAWVVAAYVSGLLAGFSDSALAALAAIALSVLAGSTRRALTACVLGAISAAGVMVARADDASAKRCLIDARSGGALTLVLDDSASPGAFAHAHLRSCDAPVSIAVERGSAPAGATIVAHGEVIPSQRGALVQHASIRAASAAPFLVRWRARIGGRIDRTFGTDAPFVRALLIADRRELTPELRDEFAAAGLAHMLAIAGLHIGIIALTVVVLLELLGMPRPRASLVSVVVVIAYVALIGAPVPAVRAATMLAALAATRVAQRPSARWAIVAIGASQPLFVPRLVLDVGYQLSVVGVTAMIASGRAARRLGIDGLPRVPRLILAAMFATSLATIATAPVVATTFGRVSVIAPLTNVVAGPLLALAQPLILFGLVLAPFGLGGWFADAAHPVLAALLRVASMGASVPHGALYASPTPFAIALGWVIALAAIAACASREWVRPAGVGLAACALFAWLPFVPSGTGMTELHMIDVGQGDAIAIRTPHGEWVLVDAGRAWRGGDAGRSTVVPYIGRRGGRLDAFVLSHPHTDHVGGASTIFHALHPALYVDAGFPGPAGPYRASLETARDERVQWRRAHPGDSLSIDGVTFTFLAPDSTWTAHLDDPNLASIVTLVRVGKVRMLLMGDAERAEEDWLLRHTGDLHADVLKVGHHGSSTSSTQSFLDAVSPRLALVSVGAGNSYGLPSANVMRDLAARGAQVLRTDRLGTIVAKTDGVRLYVQADGDEWELPRDSAPSRMP